MQNFKIIITPKSSFITDLQSDTIFGHICWAIKYLQGEDKLKDFLDIYQIEPPLLLSSGFPRIKIDNQIIDFLPKPILRPLSLDEEENLFNIFCKNLEKNKKQKVLFSSTLKNLKKQKYISSNAFEKIKDNLSYEKLYELIFKENFCPQNFIPKPDECKLNYYECPILNYEAPYNNCSKELRKKLILIKSNEVYHNTKNRLTDKVAKEGGLFSTENIFYNDNIELVIYVKDDYFSKEELKKIFKFIAYSGFGADKSTGKGSFTFEIEENFKLPVAENPNAFLSLANYYPAKDETKDGYYETLVKFGKLGGDWAKTKDKTYFKMPIIFIAPGGVFKTTEIKNYYGCLIPKVHLDERIVQYGLTIPLGVKII